MAKKVPIKKLLRADDAFLTTSEKLFLYVKKNTRKIALIVALAVAAALTGLVLKSVNDAKLARALDSYRQAVKIEDAVERNQALQAVRTDYPGTKAARQASYSLLSESLGASDLEEALPLIDEIIKTVDPAEESLRPLLLAAKAGLLEQAGQLEPAFDQYKEIVSIVDSGSVDPDATPFLAELNSALGRVSMALGRNDEAKKAYENVILISPQSYRSYTAQVKLSQLLEDQAETAAAPPDRPQAPEATGADSSAPPADPTPDSAGEPAPPGGPESSGDPASDGEAAEPDQTAPAAQSSEAPKP
jgi:predicted negative regulator of RcsB-dependent stress response